MLFRSGSASASIAAGGCAFSRAPEAAVFAGSGTVELLRLTRALSTQGPWLHALCRRRRVRACRSPWTLRFHAPEAMPPAFVSPRNRMRVCSLREKVAGPCPSRTYFLARPLCPDAPAATPAAARPSRRSGRPRNLPPDRHEGMWGGGRNGTSILGEIFCGICRKALISAPR